MTDVIELDSSTPLDFDCREECFLEEIPKGQQPPRIIAVAISPNGEVETVCTTCIVDRVNNPEIYDGVLYGTHILSDTRQTELFPDDFTD